MKKTRKLNGIISIFKRAVNPQKTEVAPRSRHCALCGTEIDPPPLSVLEILSNILLGAALVAALVLVVHGADRWIDIHIHYSSENLLWHEPLEDWNQM